MIVVVHVRQGHPEVGQALLQGNRGPCAITHGQIHHGACPRRMRDFLSKRLGDLAEQHMLQLRVSLPGGQRRAALQSKGITGAGKLPAYPDVCPVL